MAAPHAVFIRPNHPPQATAGAQSKNGKIGSSYCYPRASHKAGCNTYPARWLGAQIYQLATEEALTLAGLDLTIEDPARHFIK